MSRPLERDAPDDDGVGFDATLPTGRDLSLAHDRIEFRVRESAADRLDRYLLERLGWKSRNKVQRLIQHGRVTVNGERSKPARRVQRGDVVRIVLDPGGEPNGSEDTPPPTILYEDPFLVAVDKPPHVLVHPVGRTVSGTIINRLHARYRETGEHGRRRVVPKLCHRLDRETSGVLLIAKCDVARQRLSDDFENGRVEKQYLAITEGAPMSTEFTIDVPIAAHLDREAGRGNRLARADSAGKSAETRFELLRTEGAIALLRCAPLTGRQNQIRVHLAHAGHPILGDVGYGSDPASVPGIPFPGRALLHSSALQFRHPIWGHRILLRAPFPPDFPLGLEEADHDRSRFPSDNVGPDGLSDRSRKG
ncbi:MAG: RluA family pseudouridine synthase [Planctomycetes bacterium]|nr:RluA family pseudouridine synthase [Planctomycetota bacterium]